MSKKTARSWVAFLLAALLLFEAGCSPQAAGDTGQAKLVSVPVQNTQGFAKALEPRPFSFPADFGAHPDFQTEWWYYTGNLETADGSHFGFQLTFFRRAILPPLERTPRPSDWAAEQVYLAHFALTDVASNRFRSFEKLERGAAGLAGAQGTPSFQVWLRDWSVQQTGEHTYQLRASQEDITLELQLADLKGPVPQGDQGLSQKGPQPGNASYYFSQTRLQTQGSLEVGGKTFPVTGLSWMDHEYSTSALSPGQIGWDWFALQLNDGSELMVFHIRRSDGSVDPFSSGTWIAPDGSPHPLSADAFSLTAQAHWKSPHSGANYPARWEVRVPSLGLRLQVDPYTADQENNLSFTYWEGAVRITGEREGAAISGSGYVELTGYAGSMAGQF